MPHPQECGSVQRGGAARATYIVVTMDHSPMTTYVSVVMTVPDSLKSAGTRTMPGPVMLFTNKPAVAGCGA